MSMGNELLVLDSFVFFICYGGGVIVNNIVNTSSAAPASRFTVFFVLVSCSGGDVVVDRAFRLTHFRGPRAL